jgi:hypothetical protein
MSKSNLPTSLLKIRNTQTRALWDSGAEVSCISTTLWHKICKGKSEKLENTNTELKSVSGNNLLVLGLFRTNLQIDNESFPAEFYVIKNMKRDLIIGRDFMVRYKVRLDMGQQECHIGKSMVSIASLDIVQNLVRLDQDIEVPPNSFITTSARYGRKAALPCGTKIMWKHENGGFLSREPGLAVANGLGLAKANRKIPISILNQTGRWFTLKKGNVVANITRVDKTFEISNLQASTIPSEVTDPNKGITDLKCSSLTSQQQEQFEKLLKRNSDIFAKDEFDVGCTNLMEATVDTGNARPVNKKPYRTPFAYRGEVKRQLDEMLAAKLISPSNSNWAAPIVCVKKKGR